jgi:hypothetical protein
VINDGTTCAVHPGDDAHDAATGVAGADAALQLELLAELRAALTEHEVESEVNESVGGLALATALPNVRVWVFVHHCGRYFSWSRADQQHLVRDLPGAARRLAAYVRDIHEQMADQAARQRARSGADGLARSESGDVDE